MTDAGAGAPRDELVTSAPRTRELLHRGYVWDLVRDVVELDGVADGALGSGTVTRELLRHPGAVGVLALDDDERILLVRQYRHPVEHLLWELPAGLRGVADLVVVDVFAGPQTPAHVTSVEFYRSVVELLAPHGLVAVNVADNSQLQFVRSQAATLSAVLPHVAAVADTSMLKGRRFGNVVLLGSATPLPLDTLPRVLAGDPWPAKAVAGAELTSWIAGAPVSTDATATPSPLPGRTVFSVKRD